MEHKRIVIGLTGNIASGKTTVSKLFETKGIPVFNSDQAARAAEHDSKIMKDFVDIVGSEIMVDGVLDRPKMREILFCDSVKLSKVNELMIPVVKNMFADFLLANINEKIVVCESAIIFEHGLESDFDYIISVLADEKTRYKRALKRDGANEIVLKAKISAQLSDRHKMINSDFIIINPDFKKFDMDYLLNIQVDNILDTLGY